MILNKKDFLEKFDNSDYVFNIEDIKTLIFNFKDYCVDKIIHASGRWTETVEIILRFQDRFFQVTYEQGLTELQPNEYYTDIVEVKPKSKIVEIIEWSDINV